MGGSVVAVPGQSSSIEAADHGNPRPPGAPRWRSRSFVLDGLGLVARLLLAGVWFASGLVKAADPAQTKVAVQAYRLLPDSVAVTVAAVLPYLEIAVGVILVLGLATRLGGILSGLLLIAFLIGVISAAARGLSIDCGCFGGGGQVAAGATAYTVEILRDSGLLIAAVYLVVRPSSWLSVDRLARHGGANRVEPA